MQLSRHVNIHVLLHEIISRLENTPAYSPLWNFNTLQPRPFRILFWKDMVGHSKFVHLKPGNTILFLTIREIQSALMVRYERI